MQVRFLYTLQQIYILFQEANQRFRIMEWDSTWDVLEVTGKNLFKIDFLIVVIWVASGSVQPHMEYFFFILYRLGKEGEGRVPIFPMYVFSPVKLHCSKSLLIRGTDER